MTTTESPELDLLRSRVDRLERRIRTAGAAWILTVLVLVFLGLVVHPVASEPAVLRARRIEVVDASGQARISLSVDVKGQSLQLLLRAASGDSIGLAIFADRTLALGLGDGRSALELALHRSGGSGLTLRDGEGKERIVLALRNARQTMPPYRFVEGPPTLRLDDAAGRTRFEAP